MADIGPPTLPAPLADTVRITCQRPCRANDASSEKSADSVITMLFLRNLVRLSIRPQNAPWWNFASRREGADEQASLRGILGFFAQSRWDRRASYPAR